jgi:hypothetical protein
MNEKVFVASQTDKNKIIFSEIKKYGIVLKQAILKK